MTASDTALAPVMEVFASIQGEGAYLGEPQVFLRLRGCPMRCRWCDTPGSWKLSGGDRARVGSASGNERADPWVTPFQAACWIAECEPGEPRTLSVTGGEPLAWPAFLLALKGMVGSRRVHLETAGGHPRTLERVIHVFQHVSLDLKLPADLDAPVELAGPFPGGVLPAAERAPTDDAGWRGARRRCLELVASRDACAKIVVAGGRARREFEPLLDDLARIAPEVPLFLQPATPVGPVAAPNPELLVDLAEEARDLGLAVRVVPQVHRLLGLP